MKVWKTRQRIFTSNHGTVVTGLHAAFLFFSCFQTCLWCQMWRTGGKKTKNRKANSSPGNWEKSDGLTAGTLPCCSLQLQSFYCLRPSSFGLVTMSQFVSITCTLALDRAQLCFTITEHWHRRGWTDFGLTKIHLLFIHVLDYSTVLPSPRRSECTFCCHFFLRDVNKKKSDPCCVSVCFSACFLWCRSRVACPYFSFQHLQLVCLYCPHSFLVLLSYSYPPIP